MTQTVESSCGFATQSVPVDISTSLLYQNVNFQKVLTSIPSLIQKGSDVSIDIKKLKNIKQLSITIKDSNDETVLNADYMLDGKEEQLPILMSSLNAGTFFIEFSTNGSILAAYSIRVR